MIRRPYRHQRSRSQTTQARLPGLPAVAVTLSIHTGNARLSFASPVVLNGLPVSITRQAAGAGPQLAPTSAAQVDALTIDLTYAAAVVATDIVTVPANVPEIHGVTGGNVAATAMTF